MQYIAPLAKLIEHFRALPGIGNKTAVRLAYHILDMDVEKAKALANAIVEADRAMLRNKLTTRAETRQRVRDWIENHTFAKVSMNDCRYL